MEKRRGLLVACVSVMLIVIVLFVVKETNIINKDSVFFTKKDKANQSTSAQNSEEQESNKDNVESVNIDKNGIPIYSIGEQVDAEFASIVNIKYKVNKVTVNKQHEGLPKDLINPVIEYDSNTGFIQNEYSFVVVSVQITKIYDNINKDHLYIGGLYLINDDIDNVNYELQFYNDLSRAAAKDYYVVPCADNETMEFDLIYIVPDSALNEPLFFVCDQSGISYEYDSKSKVKLEWE